MTQSRMVTGTAFVVDQETVGYTERLELEHINAAAGQLQSVVDIAVCSNLADVAVGDTVVVGSVFVVVVSAAVAAFVVVENAAVDAFVVVSAAVAALAVVVAAADMLVADDYLYYVNFLAIHNYYVFFHYFVQMKNS